MAVKKTTRAQCVRKTGHSWVKGSSSKAGYCRKRASRSRSRSRTTSRRRTISRRRITSRRRATRSRSRSSSSPRRIHYIYVPRASPRRILYTPAKSSPRRILYTPAKSSPKGKGLFGIPRGVNKYTDPNSGGSINCDVFGSKSGCESSGCNWSGSSCS